MDPITTTIASEIASLILSEAFKEGGKTLGKGVSDKITEIITTMRDKFRSSGIEGLLTRVEKQPTESNVAILEAELVTQMSEDEIFAERLAELVRQLESTSVIRLRGITGVKAGTIEVKDIIQKAKKSAYIEQDGVKDIDISGPAKFGNVNQEGSGQ